MNKADTLRNAAEKLDEVGWIQGSLQNDNGVCMMGAIGLTMGAKLHPIYMDFVLTDEQRDHLISCGISIGAAIQRIYGDSIEFARDFSDHGIVADFNDSDECTKEIAQKLLMSAADAAEFEDDDAA